MNYTARGLRAGLLIAVGVLIGRWTITVPSVSAQTPPKAASRKIQIGDVAVQLDATQDSVLAALGGKDYKVMDRGKIADGSESFVVTKDVDLLGSVYFKQGRVASATREWAWSEDPEVLAFFQKIYGAFESASSATKTGAVICRTLRSPTRLDMAVMADFGGRSVTMGFSQNDKVSGTVKNALIEESINRP